MINKKKRLLLGKIKSNNSSFVHEEVVLFESTFLNRTNILRCFKYRCPNCKLETKISKMNYDQLLLRGSLLVKCRCHKKFICRNIS
jgi:hypothetical protein